jgi:uncharacterized membrane protein YkoI
MKPADYYIRKSHRWLGILLAIQFLFWTISGLYFSWSDIDNIRSEYEKKHIHTLSPTSPLIAPSAMRMVDSTLIDSIVSLSLTTILDKPMYYIEFHEAGKHIKGLVDATSGMLRGQITDQEALLIAKANYNGTIQPQSATKIDSIPPGHEYRDKPLPAWRVETGDSKNTVMYINAHNGKVERLRNDPWRIFDFLWMTHVMDYDGRDNINNYLLRAFSIFGLITVLSGILLFFVSRKRKLN